MKHYLSLVFAASFLWMTQTVMASSSLDDDNSVHGVGAVGGANASAAVGAPQVVSGTTASSSCRFDPVEFSKNLGLSGDLQARYIQAMNTLAQQTGNPVLFMRESYLVCADLPVSSLENLVAEGYYVGYLDPTHERGKAYFALKEITRRISSRITPFQSTILEDYVNVNISPFRDPGYFWELPTYSLKIPNPSKAPYLKPIYLGFAESPAFAPHRPARDFDRSKGSAPQNMLLITWPHKLLLITWPH